MSYEKVKLAHLFEQLQLLLGKMSSDKETLLAIGNSVDLDNDGRALYVRGIRDVSSALQTQVRAVAAQLKSCNADVEFGGTLFGDHIKVVAGKRDKKP